jgi:hypothetical protein
MNASAGTIRGKAWDQIITWLINDVEYHNNSNGNLQFRKLINVVDF